MTQYVVSFIFDEKDKNKVALIKKKRPVWQAGRLNGIGGKIEEGETALHAAQRELREESRLYLLKSELSYVCSMTGDDWRVDVFTGEVKDLINKAKTMEDEEVFVLDELEILVKHRKGETISNLLWLIEMCKNVKRIDYKIDNNESILCPLQTSL